MTFTLTVVVLDSTPPVITPNVTGTLGNNGWYVSDVTVSWSVSDPDSTVTSTSDCGATVINTDTSGTTVTCSATSAGGTSSQSVTIKRDATPPGIAFSHQSPAANGSGWNNTNVTLYWSCTDATSGPVTSQVSQAITTEGAGLSATGTCYDNAGNSASHTQGGVNIDKTAPAITFVSRTPAPNSFGWNSTDVVVEWSCSDGLSGVALATVTQTVGTEGANQSATGTCYDLAGNSASNTQSGINIDKTAPTLSPSVNPSPVVLNGSATATANGSDSLSGIDSEGCDPVDTSSVGAGQTIQCSATDKAGNTAYASATYSVTYGICLLYDDDKPKKAGSTIPIRIRLCDASGNNVSSPGVTVTAFALTHMNATPPEETPEDSGNANPDNNFRYDTSLGGYIYNLSTKGLAIGEWWLWFSVSGDSEWHAVKFVLK